MTVPKRTTKQEWKDEKVKQARKKAKVKLRKVTPLPDKPNSYLVEHEVHDVEIPPPLDVPLPDIPIDFNTTYDPVVEAPTRTWAEWWKSLW
jgi:hypothetical protein